MLCLGFRGRHYLSENLDRGHRVKRISGPKTHDSRCRLFAKVHQQLAHLGMLTRVRGNKQCDEEVCIDLTRLADIRRVETACISHQPSVPSYCAVTPVQCSQVLSPDFESSLDGHISASSVNNNPIVG